MYDSGALFSVQMLIQFVFSSKCLQGEWKLLPYFLYVANSHVQIQKRSNGAEQKKNKNNNMKYTYKNLGGGGMCVPHARWKTTQAYECLWTMRALSFFFLFAASLVFAKMQFINFLFTAVALIDDSWYLMFTLDSCSLNIPLKREERKNEKKTSNLKQLSDAELENDCINQYIYIHINICTARIDAKVIFLLLLLLILHACVFQSNFPFGKVC